MYHKDKNKLRLVFDCSARYQGICLNDCLYQGPDLTNTLIGVLLRFRQGPIAIQGNIESMFYHIQVPAKGRDLLRFLWWEEGRLKLAEVPYASKHPIRLHNASSIVPLIIQDVYNKLGHVGRQHVLAQLRNKFWITKANAAVRRTLSNCTFCRKMFGKPIAQKWLIYQKKDSNLTHLLSPL